MSEDIVRNTMSLAKCVNEGVQNDCLADTESVLWPAKVVISSEGLEIDGLYGQSTALLPYYGRNQLLK